VFLAQTVLLLGLAGSTLVRQYRKSKNLERQQFKYVIFGLSITFGLIFITNFVLVAFFQINWLLPYGAAYTLFFTGSVAYAVVTQRLFDIRFFVARTITYLLLLLTFEGIYAATGFWIVSVLLPGTSTSFNQVAIYTMLAMVLAFTFHPLKRFFQNITDHIFYRHLYDSQVVLNNFSKILVSERDLDRILKRTITALCESLNIEFGQLVIFNNERVYRVEHYGELPKRLMVAPELSTLKSPMIVADELEGGQRKQLMEEHGIRVSLTLKTREEFVGYLLLGDKLSGDIYSNQDLDLLEIIGKQLAVAILNAKAYAQIEEFNLTLAGAHRSRHQSLARGQPPP